MLSAQPGDKTNLTSFDWTWKMLDWMWKTRLIWRNHEYKLPMKTVFGPFDAREMLVAKLEEWFWNYERGKEMNSASAFLLPSATTSHDEPGVAQS